MSVWKWPLSIIKLMAYGFGRKWDMRHPGGRKNSGRVPGMRDSPRKIRRDGPMAPEHREPATWQKVDYNKWIHLSYGLERDEPRSMAKLLINIFLSLSLISGDMGLGKKNQTYLL